MNAFNYYVLSCINAMECDAIIFSQNSAITYVSKPYQTSEHNKGIWTKWCCNRNENSSHTGKGIEPAKDMLAPKPLSQPAPRDLCQQIAPEICGEDESLGLLVPQKRSINLFCWIQAPRLYQCYKSELGRWTISGFLTTYVITSYVKLV